MSKQKVNCAKGTREADLGHAVLSASGSHRWLNCTPSARLELEFENTTSEAAREGTAAHALCEHKLKKFLKKRSKRPVSDYNSDEMEECTDAYAEFVMEQYEEAKKSCKDPVILIEQKLDFSCYVPEGFGTGDCIIISDDKLHIIDFKYGQQVTIMEDKELYKKFPLVYRGRYDIFKVETNGVVWMAIYPKDNVGLIMLRRDRAKVEKITGLNCAIFLDRTTFYIKEKLLEEGIPFVPKLML